MQKEQKNKDIPPISEQVAVVLKECYIRPEITMLGNLTEMTKEGYEVSSTDWSSDWYTI